MLVTCGERGRGERGKEGGERKEAKGKGREEGSGGRGRGRSEIGEEEGQEGKEEELKIKYMMKPHENWGESIGDYWNSMWITY